YRQHEWEGCVQSLSRRQFGRMAVLLTAGAALPFYNESALAQDLKVIASIPPDAVRLHTNENPMGPCPAALEAIRSGRWRRRYSSRPGRGITTTLRLSGAPATSA